MKIIRINVGGPAYMASYTDMMMTLLAFFILLNTLQKQRQSGFDAGVGEVREAMGIKGGQGLQKYLYFGGGGGHTPNPDEVEDGEEATHEKLLKDEGGEGNNDADIDKKATNKYLKMKLPYSFESKKTDLSKDFKDYLKKVGLIFALRDYKITVKYYSNDNNDSEMDTNLSLDRGAIIMNALRKRGIRKSNLQLSVYSEESSDYLKRLKKTNNKIEQLGYFYIYKK